MLISEGLKIPVQRPIALLGDLSLHDQILLLLLIAPLLPYLALPELIARILFLY
jgi:hypothetical protein